MNQSTYNSLKSFIWGIANDCLVDVYDVGDYRKIILPMFVIRRFDAVLEPKHEAVIKAKKEFTKAGITELDAALAAVAEQAFVNKSDFTLTDLKSRTNQQQLKKDFIEYLDGFSENVQVIINKFHIRNEIDRLSEQDRLGLLIEKFVDPRINLSNRPVLNEDGSVKIEALDNHTMGTLFEEVIRMFNEETNVTDAGRHFTPRDIVELIADLAFIPVQDKIQSTTYRIYDGACGTGGMLTVGDEHIKKLAREQGKKVSIHLYGQENADETYAIARADMLVKGEGKESDQIRFGSTISDDKFAKEEFDFMLSNPPFGTPWKTDLKAWGIGKKDEISDTRFIINYDDNPEYSLIPDIGDPQMLFLANNISKMKTTTELGSRIIEVHNGSSLFTGKAGSGPSNLRRYIFEQDLCEAIIAIPENMFYNTGIGTYLWVLTNKKDEKRKGKVQLIDATSMKEPLRKNLGDKNCEMTQKMREKVMELYLAFDKADSEYSKVFSNEEFGFYQVEVNRPLRLRVNVSDEALEEFKNNAKDDEFYDFLMTNEKDTESTNFNSFIGKLEKSTKRAGLKWTKKRENAIRKYFTTTDENANVVLDKKGNTEPDSNLKDTEQVPLLYDGGITGFFENEVKPYVEDAWINEDSAVIGYELSFTKYFYKPVQLRDMSDIIADGIKLFHGLGTGLRQTLTSDEVLKLQIPVPPKPEQDKIVQFLDWKISEMNHFIHQKKKQIKLLEELKYTQIDQYITKGLNPSVSMKDSKVEWIGAIPEHWDVDHIKQHFKVKKRIAGKEGYDVLSITQQGIKKKDISSNEGQMAQSYANYQFVYPGDFAMNHMDLLTGYIDISKQFGVTSPDYRVFTLSDSEHCFAPFYLRVFQIGYKRRIFYKFGKGAANQGRWRLPITAFYDYAIQVPPIDEQREIARQCDEVEKQINEMISGINKEITLVEELRTKLISDVVTGQVDVRNVKIPAYETETDIIDSEEDSDEENQEESTE